MIQPIRTDLRLYGIPIFVHPSLPEGWVLLSTEEMRLNDVDRSDFKTIVHRFLAAEKAALGDSDAR